MFTPIQTTAINGISAYTSQCSYAGQTPAAGESVTKTISYLSIAQDENYKYIVNKQGGQFRLMGEKKAASDSFTHYIDVRIQRPSSVSPYGYILDITSDLPEYDKLQQKIVSNPNVSYLCLQVKDSQNRYFWITPFYLGRSVLGLPLFDIKYIYNGSWSDGVDRSILIDNYITKSNVYPTWINYYTVTWEPLMYDTIKWVKVKFKDTLPASTRVSVYETH